MKKLSYLIVLALILGLVLTGCTLLSNVGQVPTTEQSGITYLTKRGPTIDDADEFPLYAGQDWEVGKVWVWNDGIQVCVKYELDEDVIDADWLLYETHLEEATTLEGIPQKNGNPPPGQFRYGDDELGGVESWQDCILFEDILGFTEELNLCGEPLVIAAHAVIEKTECEVIVPAPYSACNIVEYLQGLRQDGTAVKTERSVPENALYYEIGKNESNFFSLGFGGWMILEFGCPITNGDGNDIRIIEDTWGTYPVEKAMVSASQNGIDWTELGEANNEARDPVYNYHTISEFDLGDLEWATYIKVVDTTDISLYGSRPNAEGYDLNAVLALHDCEECTTYSETAWGAVSEGFEPFPGKNWATFINYSVQQVLLDTVQVTPLGTGADQPIPTYSNIMLEAGSNYHLVAKGTYRFANWGDFGIADAAWNYRSAAYAPDGVAGWYQQASQRLQVWIGGAAVAWQPTVYNSEHIYMLDVIAKGDEQLMFTIMDDAYSDNSGSITVEIWGCPTP